MGDVLGIVTRQAVESLRGGCRYTSPHASLEPWRYAVVAERASMCGWRDGWRCVFNDTFAPLPPGHADLSIRQLEDERRIVVSHCAPTGLMRYGLHRSQLDFAPPWNGRLLPPATGLSTEASAARAALEPLLAVQARGEEQQVASWVESQMLTFTWALSPRVAAHVRSVRRALGLSEGGAGSAALPSPYIAVHMRRGDACKCFEGCCWSNRDGAPRACRPVEDYVRLARLLAAALSARRVFVATEDAADDERAAALLRAAGLEPVAQAWDRRSYSAATAGGSCDGGGDVFTRIEAAMDRGTVDAHGMLLSAAADLQLLAGAAGVVGGASSFSRQAVRLGAAQRGAPLPFVDVASAAAGAWLDAGADADDPAASGVGRAAGPGACPSCGTFAAAFDADADGRVRECECASSLRPLERLRLAGGELSLACRALYECMAVERCCDALPATRPAEDACRRADLGPFPCLEDGCPDEPAVDCRYLAEGGVCDSPVADVWERPLAWLSAEGAHVWQACPHACGRCPRKRQPTSFDAHFLDGAAGGQERGSCDA